MFTTIISIDGCRQMLYASILSLFFCLSAMLCQATTAQDNTISGEGSVTKDFSGTYVTLDELVVNIPDGDEKNHFFKLGLTLEVLTKDEAKRVNDAMPHIIDQFNIFLVGLRAEDVQGQRGLMLLKSQLHTIANSVVAPTKISNVLFRLILLS